MAPRKAPIYYCSLKGKKLCAKRPAPLSSLPDGAAKVNSYLRASAGSVPKRSEVDFNFYPQRTCPTDIGLSGRPLGSVLVVRTQILLYMETVFPHNSEFRIIMSLSCNTFLAIKSYGR